MKKEILEIILNAIRNLTPPHCKKTWPNQK